MIEYLDGKVVSRKPTVCVVDVHGIGYEVLVPMSTFASIPSEGSGFKFYTHHHVREDTEQLFGFASVDERSVFRSLISVSGVGPKLGLAALSALRPEDLRRCVASSDVAQLTRIPGVGRKTAERMIVELRDRLVPTEGDAVGGRPPAAGRSSVENDAILALESLGLSRTAAEKQVAAVAGKQPGTPTTEEIIRLALKGR